MVWLEGTSDAFDTQPPINTPQIFNTIDAGTGLTSSVAPLPAATTSKAFNVSWSGTDAANGSAINAFTIFVSDNTVREVPDVTGLTQDDAESQLRDEGFAVGVRTRSTDQPDEDGIVLSQSPSGGAERRERATVTITVGALATPEGTPTP